MMRVRPAAEGDLEAVHMLLAEDVIREVDEPAVVTTRQRAALREIIASAHQDVLVGVVGDTIVATCQVSWLRHLIYDGGLICQIESVRVARQERGQGYGAALMEYVCAVARDRGCARIQLTTNARREAARRFYERLGFVSSHVGMKRYLAEVG